MRKLWTSAAPLIALFAAACTTGVHYHKVIAKDGPIDGTALQRDMVRSGVGLMAEASCFEFSTNVWLELTNSGHDTLVIHPWDVQLVSKRGGISYKLERVGSHVIDRPDYQQLRKDGEPLKLRPGELADLKFEFEAHAVSRLFHSCKAPEQKALHLSFNGLERTGRNIPVEVDLVLE